MTGRRGPLSALRRAAPFQVGSDEQARPLHLYEQYRVG